MDDKMKDCREIKFGGFWVRAAACSIDMSIIFFFLSIIFFSFFIGGVFIVPNTFHSLMTSDSIVIDQSPILIIIAMFLYFPIMHSSPWQATFGKKALHLQVVNEEGGRISFWVAIVRSCAELISMYLLFIGHLLVLLTKKKQAFHDIIAGTYVIYRM